MTAPRKYRFQNVTRSDLPLLASWLARPHVRPWWESEPLDRDDLRDPRVARWIVELDGCPFAFLQDYTVHGWPDHHFAELPPGTRGIDQYIGDPAMIGQGHGPGFIAQRVRSLLDAGAPMVATDPHPDNRRAIAAYERVGFRAFAPPRDTEWGLVLPMRIWMGSTFT